MDTGLGEFASISKNVAREFLTDNGYDMTKSRIFVEGEEVKLKGSRFKIEKIKKRTLRLLLLPDQAGELGAK